MCEECRENEARGEEYMKGITDWLDSHDEITMPEGLADVVSISGAKAGSAAKDPLIGELIGLMLVATCRIAFFAGVRQAQLEREAPNGEGEMAPVQMVPIERPVSKS